MKIIWPALFFMVVCLFSTLGFSLVAAAKTTVGKSQKIEFVTHNNISFLLLKNVDKNSLSSLSEIYNRRTVQPDEVIDAFMISVFGEGKIPKKYIGMSPMDVMEKAKNNRNRVWNKRVRVKKFARKIKLYVVGKLERPSYFLDSYFYWFNYLFPYIDLTITTEKRRANYEVHLFYPLDRVETYVKVVSKYRRITNKLKKQVLASNCSFFFTSKKHKIKLSHAFIINDPKHRLFERCIFEEISQGFGLTRDNRYTWNGVFSDFGLDSKFDIVDIYIVNMLYHPKIKAGMSSRQVKRVIQQVFREVDKKLSYLTVSP